MDIVCWICGETRPLSKEHLIKNSDLTHVFGNISQKSPKYLHRYDERQSSVINSFKRDKHIRSTAPMCDKCNNERTQKYDRAWDKLHAYLTHSQPKKLEVLDLNEVFDKSPLQQMRRVQLYFSKLFGCRIVSNGVPLPLQSLTQALLNEEVYPNLYLSIGFSDSEITGLSPMIRCEGENDNALVTFIYSVSHVHVKVSYTEFDLKDTASITFNPNLQRSVLQLQYFK